MPKKTKNPSSKQTKQHRQAKALAARQENRGEAHKQDTLTAASAAITAGGFNVVDPDGQERFVSLERMRVHVNADLAADGEDGFPDLKSFVAHHLANELDWGVLWLRKDGRWDTTEDYFTDRAREAS
ncbi:hypothetical protein [Streptomyces sp. NPDC056227]|uniref:hypothetical protein n=1 Tax=Streptomyces sp. NPDC056227 TaxID=3345753 RepID=UPI0035DE2947